MLRRGEEQATCGPGIVEFLMEFLSIPLYVCGGEVGGRAGGEV